jgi:hypothetical protein
VKPSQLFDAETFRRHRLASICALGVVALALFETGNALLAPLAAPTDKDWRAAAAEVRAGFHPGDLIVAAPGWADPILRQHLGDLIPLTMAGRLDSARFGRIWEVAQRGARAPETAGLTASQTSRHGALRLRRFEQPAAKVSFDFVADWTRATVSRIEGGAITPCDRLPHQVRCPDIPSSPIKPELLEIDTAPHFALGFALSGHATTVMEYADVPLGRELAVGAGLHNVWQRKAGKGTVSLRVLVAGRELGRIQAGNLTGWTIRRFDTSTLAGQTQTVRFEITVDDPHSRYLGFAAEARQ